MKKIGSLILTFLLIVTAFCGCEQPKMNFDSVSAMKSFFNGVWFSQDSTTYFIISDTECIEYNESLSINDYYEASNIKFNSDFNYFYFHILPSHDITYDYENSKMIIEDIGTFLVLESGEVKSDENYILEKEYEYSSDFMAVLRDEYSKESQKAEQEEAKRNFEEKYQNLPTAMEVKFNKFNYLSQNFKISGTAELDDYYNWGYDGLEPLYFCMRVRPTGGGYSDEWYIYADRTKFADLYQSLLEGSKNVTLISKIWFYDTGSNDMATLEDYYLGY